MWVRTYRVADYASGSYRFRKTVHNAVSEYHSRKEIGDGEQDDEYRMSFLSGGGRFVVVLMRATELQYGGFGRPAGFSSEYDRIPHDHAEEIAIGVFRGVHWHSFEFLRDGSKGLELQDNGYRFVGSSISGIGLPAWPLAVLFSILPVLWLRKALTKKTPVGHCPSCGYDLRATPGRCPECGKIPHRSVQTSS